MRRSGITILREYLDGVVLACRDVLGDDLSSAWVVGSLVTGGFDRRRSDIDVIATCSGQPARPSKLSLAERLAHANLPCPARGLDLVLYEASEIAEVARVPTYAFSIASGSDWDDEIGWGGPYPGGLIDLALAKRRGRTLTGPDPGEAVGRIPDAWLAAELVDGMRWHIERIHDPFHDPTGANAVLNGCRAACFLRTGGWTSKAGGGRWFLAERAVPVVRDALALREKGNRPSLDRSAVVAFLTELCRELGGTNADARIERREGERHEAP